MPKCVRCEELFSVDEGDFNEDKEFVCAMCAEGFDDKLIDDEDLDLDEDEEDEGEEVTVKPKACPGCKEKSVDYAESGICPDCGYEKDVRA
ncbi:MAG: hypothetical protein KBD07_05725 [Candidatus Omnitrophica bacterium]|jgi:hypothetical protein|nr:hypothetical protein [Candidatus Omnitrophota bacterium]